VASEYRYPMINQSGCLVRPGRTEGEEDATSVYQHLLSKQSGRHVRPERREEDDTAGVYGCAMNEK